MWAASRVKLCRPAPSGLKYFMTRLNQYLIGRYTITVQYEVELNLQTVAVINIVMLADDTCILITPTINSDPRQ
jgi:hypothetical protein